MKKIIIVTGASSGIGREFAKQIVNVVAVDEIWLLGRSKKRLELVAEKLEIKKRIIPIDLTKENELQHFNEYLSKENPQILILANCAGYGKLNHYENESLDTYRNMVDLNIKGYMSMINYSLPYMKKGAKIMNIVSSTAFQPIPYFNVYSATKAFLLSYSLSLNEELSYRGIHVLAVCPYWVMTNFYDRAIEPYAKKVVLHYGKIYPANKIVRKAITDLFTEKKISTYGIFDKVQIFLSRVMPYSLSMKFWMILQKLDGTRDIRKY